MSIKLPTFLLLGIFSVALFNSSKAQAAEIECLAKDSQFGMQSIWLQNGSGYSNSNCKSGTMNGSNDFTVKDGQTGGLAGSWCAGGPISFHRNGQLASCTTANIWLNIAPHGDACRDGKTVSLNSDGSLRRCD